jgi:energy-coupling factor transporter ATP-binding protein EcfA2
VKLKSITLENFRIFKDATTFEFKPLTILTGPNSSGKSTVVKALMLLQENLKAPNYLGRLTFESGNHKLGDFRSIINTPNFNDSKTEIKFILEFEVSNPKLRIKNFKTTYVYDFEYYNSPHDYSKNGVLKRFIISINDKEHFCINKISETDFSIKIHFDKVLSHLITNNLFQFDNYLKENIIESRISTETLITEKERQEEQRDLILSDIEGFNPTEYPEIEKLKSDYNEFLKENESKRDYISEKIETLELKKDRVNSEKIDAVTVELENKLSYQEELSANKNSLTRKIKDVEVTLNKLAQIENNFLDKMTLFEFASKNYQLLPNIDLKLLGDITNNITIEKETIEILNSYLLELNISPEKNEKLQDSYESLNSKRGNWDSNDIGEITFLEDTIKNAQIFTNHFSIELRKIAEERLSILKKDILTIENNIKEIEDELKIIECKKLLHSFIQNSLELNKRTEEYYELKDLSLLNNEIEGLKNDLEALQLKGRKEYDDEIQQWNGQDKMLREEQTQKLSFLQKEINREFLVIEKQLNEDIARFDSYLGKSEIYKNFKSKLTDGCKKYIQNIKVKGTIIDIKFNESKYISDVYLSNKLKYEIEDLYSFWNILQISGSEIEGNWSAQLEKILDEPLNESVNHIFSDSDWNSDDFQPFVFIKRDIEERFIDSFPELENIEKKPSIIEESVRMNDIFLKNILSENIITYIEELINMSKISLNFSVIPADRGKQIRIHQIDKERLPLTNALSIYDGLNEERKDFVKKWLGNPELNKEGELGFDIGEDLEIENLEGDYLKGYVIKNGNKINIADLGLGITQIIPIIILTASNINENSLIYIEEPGTHLHPDFHEMLIDFLFDANKQNVNFLVETHSSILIKSIHYGLMEELPQLDNNNLNMFFIESSILNKVGISSKGIDRFYLDYWKNFYGKYTQKERKERKRLESEKRRFEKGYNKLKANIKCIVLSEDEDLSFVEKLLWHSGFIETETEVRSYNGCGNLPAALELAKFIQERYTNTKIVIHRDRDYLHDDEVKEIKDKLIQRGIKPFITDGTDIECYFLRSEHIEVVFKFSKEEAESILSKAIEEAIDISCDKFCAKEFGGKHRDKKSHLKDFIFEKVRTNRRFIYGKTALDYLKKELRGNGNITNPSKYIKIKQLQDIAKEIWRNNTINQ